MPIDYPPAPIARCEWDPSKTTTLAPDEGEILDEDRDLDTELPEGWVRVTARRKITNPGYLEETAQIKQAIRMQIEAGRKSGEVTKANVREVRTALRAQLDGARTEPRYLIEVVEGVYSPAYAGMVQQAAKLPTWTTTAEAPSQAPAPPSNAPAAPWAG